MHVSRCTLAIATLAALILAAPAFAQDRGGRGGRGFGRGFGGFRGGGINKVRLLGSDEVRAELKVTEEQAKKIDEIIASHREASRGAFEDFPGRDASEEALTKWREERAKKAAALVKEAEKKLEPVLQKEQVWRLDEILLQQQGTDGLVTERVVAALELSEEQVGKIKKSIEVRDEKLGELMRGLRGRGRDRDAFQEFREKRTALSEETEKAVLAVLTDKQKEGYAKLKGEEFELDPRSLNRRRGGRGGRDGADDGGNRGRRRPPVEDGNSI